MVFVQQIQFRFIGEDLHPWKLIGRERFASNTVLSSNTLSDGPLPKMGCKIFSHQQDILCVVQPELKCIQVCSSHYRRILLTKFGFVYRPCGFVLVFQPADSQLFFLICWYMCTLADLGFLNRTSGIQDKHILFLTLSFAYAHLAHFCTTLRRRAKEVLKDMKKASVPAI